MGALDFNPMDPAFVADPYPTYHRLRTQDPVHLSPLGFWVLTRYSDVAAVLRDGRFAKEAIPAFVAARFSMAIQPTALSMLDRDPPDHTRLRSLVSKAFTPRVVEGLGLRIQQIVNGLLERVEPAGSMDLIEQFAYPLPVGVICEMLGVPVEDHAQFKDWGLDVARGLDAILLPADSDVLRRAVAARHALTDYFYRLIAARRATPRSDLLSALIAAEEAGDKLSEQELLATCILLLIAGHETTVNLIGNGTLALLRHPEQLRRLREHPELIGSAVEELLRYDGPVQRTARIPNADVVIGSRTIANGEMVMPFIGAADRDPAHFADPDRLDKDVLGGVSTDRSVGHRAQGDPGFQAVLTRRVQGQTRRDGYDRDLHRPPPAGLQEGRRRIGWRRWHRDTKEMLFRTAPRASRPRDQPLERQLPLASHADQRDPGVERDQWRDEIRGRRGADDVPADGGDIAHLGSADRGGSFREGAEWAGQPPRTRDLAVGDAGAYDDAVADLETGQTRCPAQADHVAGPEKPPLDLED